MTASLHGIRVACFYPWSPHEPSGAWTRFTSHWRFLQEEAGADVTMAFLSAGNDVDLGTLHLRHLGAPVVPFNTDSLVRWLDARPGSRKWSPSALEMLWRYEPEHYLEQPRVAAWLDEIVRSHDVVTCEYPLLAPLLAPFCRKWGRPLVVTCHDILFELHGMVPQEKEMLKRRELEALRLADARVFCNDSERQFFDKLGLPGLTIRNTSDVRSVSLGGEKESQLAIAAELKLASARYCLFVGSDHEPNRKAVDEVRKLAKLTPELSFVVVGKCCEPLVDGNFVALGAKPEPYLGRLLRGAFAVVVPLLRGTGASVKLFQAFTYGKATVSTPIGARGYNVLHERELLIAPNITGFAIALRRLAGDEALRTRLERAARDFAEQLDFRQEFRPYAETILRLLKRSVSPTPVPRPANAPTLILADNNLVDRIGHHFNYALSLKEQCNQAGMGFAALVKRTAAADITTELEAQSVFIQGIHEDSPLNPYPREWGHLRATYDFFLANDCFARELAEGLARSARPGDIVFVPNATPKQMLGIALLLDKNPIYRNLSFVLLMRYSVIMATGPFSARKPALDKATAEKYSLAFEVMGSADPDGVVRFVTDSDGLAKEFMQFSRGRVVSVLPIPHTLCLPPDAPTPAVPSKDPQRLRIIYLGDAREEKGFAMLPAAVRACHLARQPVEFVFQAFISSPYHQQMAAVIEELDRLNLPQVRLIRTTLDPNSYHALLHSADLVLIPHDAVTYHSRTSGTFVEAICADKPVVAPGNSWMSDQLNGSRAGATFVSGNAADFARAVQGAVTDIAVHRQAAAELGRNFRDYHNPQNFLQKLRQV